MGRIGDWFEEYKLEVVIILTLLILIIYCLYIKFIGFPRL